MSLHGDHIFGLENIRQKRILLYFIFLIAKAAKVKDRKVDINTVNL